VLNIAFDITVQCYTEHGIATASRPSVRLSVTFVYPDHVV